MTTLESVPPAGNAANTPRGGNGRFRRSRSTAERDSRVAELLEAGWSFREVAREMGYRSPASVHEAFGRAVALAGQVKGGHVPSPPPPIAHPRQRPSVYELAGDIVYYLQVGDLVKIGVTSDLARRLTYFPPNTVVLAVEPGGYDVEQARHAQFGDLLAGRREWFHPGPALLAHIATLAR